MYKDIVIELNVKIIAMCFEYLDVKIPSTNY